MDDATGALSRVSVSPDGLAIDVDTAHALARSMLKRMEMPEGPALETTLVEQERTIRSLIVGVMVRSAKEHRGFRVAARSSSSEK